MRNFFTDKQVVVTGGGGFIGSYLVRELIRLGASVHALVDEGGSTNRLDSFALRAHIHRVSVWNRDALKPMLQRIKPQIIFHLRAAIHQASNQERKEYFFKTNVGDTKELANAALALELESFVNAGTIAEYGGAPAPFEEDEIAAPISEYGESKLAATIWLKSLHKTHGFPAILVRSSVVYGPGQHPHSYLIPNVIMSCLQKKDFQIKSSGLQTRDPLYISDDVAGLLMAAANTQKTQGEIINLGLGREYTVFEIAQLINQKLGNLVNISTGSDDDRPGENKNYWQNISKAEKLFGWTPKISLEKGINETVTWYKEHYKDGI
ncbi:hypothetical protein BK004_01460 [bacterium CG10_46_32]|nr:MAG: hypothetical protein BK004_01460 [bacterium CG10_46_32]PIR56365.1 MAG: hypothetical protein COU73_01475 [Parcubacteria group bacterium CG10_big_fil_rev_8_21_14_0_10_46_32]